MFSCVVPGADESKRGLGKSLRVDDGRRHTTQYLRQKYLRLLHRLERKKIFASSLNAVRAQAALNAELEASLGHLGSETQTIGLLRMMRAARKNLASLREDEATAYSTRASADQVPSHFNHEQQIKWELDRFDRIAKERDPLALPALTVARFPSMQRSPGTAS